MFRSGHKPKIANTVATIKLQDGKVITKDGKVSCSCCVVPEIQIDWKYASGYAENGCGVAVGCTVYQTEKFPFYTTQWTSTETGNVDPDTGANEILCESVTFDAANSEDENYREYLNPIENVTLYYTEYGDWNTANFAPIQFQRSRSNNIKSGEKIIYRIPPERIPDGYTVKIQKSYQAFTINEPSCYLDISSVGSFILPEEEYAGGEVEFIAEDLYNDFYEGSDSVFAVFATINAVLEPSA